jgi:hypothetical protein
MSRANQPGLSFGSWNVVSRFTTRDHVVFGSLFRQSHPSQQSQRKVSLRVNMPDELARDMRPEVNWVAFGDTVARA